MHVRTQTRTCTHTLINTTDPQAVFSWDLTLTLLTAIFFRLSITGQHVQAYQAPVDLLSTRVPDTGQGFSSLEEEIIEQDGEVEDIIAIDYRST